MAIYVKYSNFDSTIDEVKVELDAVDKFVTYTPKTRTTTVGGTEVVEKYIEYKYSDETTSYETLVELDKKETNELIKVLNQLLKSLA